MRKPIFVLPVLLLMLSLSAFAASNSDDADDDVKEDPKKEVLLSGKIKSGGFGGPVLKVSRLLDTTGILVGGYGGWVIDQRFLLGGGGYGLTNEILRNGDRANLGYGGVMLQYYLFPSKLFQVAFSTLFGAGSAGFVDPNNSSRSDENTTFVFEPEAAFLLNLTHFTRLSLGAGYRVCTGAKEFSGFAASAMVQFGSGM